MQTSNRKLNVSEFSTTRLFEEAIPVKAKKLTTILAPYLLGIGNPQFAEVAGGKYHRLPGGAFGNGCFRVDTLGYSVSVAATLDVRNGGE